jgi:flagellar protein FlgJ
VIGPVTSGGATPAKTTVDPGMRKAAEAFEAVFVRQLIGSMRSSSLGDDILGSDASDQFRDMADAKTADNMAQQGALGIAEMMIAQLSKTVAVEKHVEATK